MRLIASAFALLLCTASAQAAELRIACPGIVYNAALYDIVADFNKKTGHTAVIERTLMCKLVERVKGGTPPADVIGMPVDMMNTLYLDGGVAAGSYTPLGRGELGLAVKKGAPKPDISSEEALRRVVMAAATIGYSTGPSGTALLKLFERWGVADALRERLVQAPPGVPVGSLVAEGKVALGFQQLAELIHQPGIEVVGPMPEPVAITAQPVVRCLTSVS